MQEFKVHSGCDESWRNKPNIQALKQSNKYLINQLYQMQTGIQLCKRCTSWPGMLVLSVQLRGNPDCLLGLHLSDDWDVSLVLFSLSGL